MIVVTILIKTPKMCLTKIFELIFEVSREDHGLVGRDGGEHLGQHGRDEPVVRAQEGADQE